MATRIPLALSWSPFSWVHIHHLFVISHSLAHDSNLCTVNHAPIALDDHVTMAEGDGPLAINVLANDFDLDYSQLVHIADTTYTTTSGNVTLTGPVQIGTQTVYTGVTFAANYLFFGLTSFNYTITDGAGGYDTATVWVNVTFGERASILS